jgi:hypothetical protein
MASRPEIGPPGVTRIPSSVKFAATAAASFLSSASVCFLMAATSFSRSVDPACLFVGQRSAKQSSLPILQGQVGCGFSFIFQGFRTVCRGLPDSEFSHVAKENTFGQRSLSDTQVARFVRSEVNEKMRRAFLNWIKVQLHFAICILRNQLAELRSVYRY